MNHPHYLRWARLALVLLPLVALPVLAREVIIDVRSAEEYAAEHIEGAIHIDHARIAQEIGKARVGKDDAIILYDQSGRRAEVARRVLQRKGYRHVDNYGSIHEARKRLQRRP